MSLSEHTTDKLKRLLQSRNWSEQDRCWLLQYLEETDQAELRALMEKLFASNAAAGLHHAKADKLLAGIHKKIDGAEPKASLFAVQWRRLLIAASILLVIGVGAIGYFNGTTGSKTTVTSVHTAPVPHDIAPGRDNATLTLADGTTIVLDSASNGALAEQGKIKVLKLNGKITYDQLANGTGESLVYNTVTTAKGNQYQLILADGSSVWLNAASSIRFPVSFSGKERKVEMTGEAYFEVAHDAAKPFIVKINSTAGNHVGDVQVMGTHFNVSAYDDEPDVKTTLMEGKVTIKHATGSMILAPLHQAVFNKTAGQGNVQPADVEEAIGWKEGMFEFHDADLRSIMRQLARWYNVDVNFSGAVSGKLYNGSIRRQATLSQVLQILKLAGVNYSLEGRSLTVTEG